MKNSALFTEPTKPDSYLIAYTDGGARGNPGPAGYGVFITDQAGHKLAELSHYLGNQTNNYAEYSGLIAALEWAVQNGHRALQVVSDSELMVKQMKGIYKVSNAQLQELHARAKRLTSQLDWFNIQHVLRGKNKDADRLANEAMDKGSGRPKQAEAPAPVISGVFHGVVKNGKIELLDGPLPEGTKVLIRKA
ncbi:MAG TPA: ribonuclease HI family protein [Terriglobales bacterium]|nr:ribonuclease HI family protein [Terriglobales bacterium]